MQGNNYQIDKEPLLAIPICRSLKQEHVPIIALVDQILLTTKNDDYTNNPAKQAKVKELECQIDQSVYELYGLTPEEIAVVEGSNAK
jgi:adenine-specific DNA-methyltransferase